VERTQGEGLRTRFDVSLERGRLGLRTLNHRDPTAGNVFELVSEGRSRRFTLNANGGYMKPGARASLLLGYLLTDSKNDGDVLSVPTTPLGIAAEWGSAPNDIRHRVFGFARARVGKGFSASTMGRFESGAPYNVTTGFDDNGDQVVNDRPAGTRRNAARGAARVSIDVRLSWSRGFGPERAPRGPQAHIVRMGDGEMPGDAPGPDANRRFQLSVYAQAFNATNHTNARAYSGVLTSPFFGQPLLAEPGRRIELGASVGF
jgi:hypothetical protein